MLVDHEIYLDCGKCLFFRKIDAKGIMSYPALDQGFS